MTVDPGTPRERKPYTPPQTSMERHIAELVEHLQNGTDTRSGFASKIEDAFAHAFWLERVCADQRAEIRKLEDEMAIALPRVSVSFTDVEIKQRTHIAHDLMWHIPAIHYRVLLDTVHTRANDETWARIRKWTFRALVKELRKQYETCVPARIKR